MVKIVNVGMQANLTDSGRRFAQCQGYSQSGAMDWFNFKLANALCKNPLDATAIEIMAGSFSMQIMENCFVAITGADCDLRLNNQSIDINEVIPVKEGDTLSIQAVKSGLYNYIAIHGANFQHAVKLFRTSICATSREGVGGLEQDGTGLKKGQQIPLQIETSTNASTNNNAPSSFSFAPHIVQTINYLSKQTSGNELPIVFSYQANNFEVLQQTKLVSSIYHTTNNMNQMGVRLEGPRIAYKSNTLTSQPIALGAIQIPQNGQPIIMRNERQTIGGYPIIGAVSRVGLARLSQLTPNTPLSFNVISQDNALCLYRMITEHLKQIAMR